MSRRSQRCIHAAVVASLLGVSASANAALSYTAYSDNFDRTGLNGGTYSYNTVVTAGDGGADVGATFNGVPSTPNLLTLTNDATATVNGNGAVYITTPTSAYTGFNQMLSGNVGSILTWTFNMEDVRTNPSGFATGNYGNAVILGATSSTFIGAGAGDGYAAIIGNSLAPDPIRLVKFTGGLAVSTTIVTNSTQNVSTDYWSVKVTYDATINAWELSTRDDGATGFSDPAAGVLVSSGTAIDTTYTSVALTHSGTLWNYSTAANQVARDDNFTLTIGEVPEPVALPLAVIAMASLRRRRRSPCG